MGSSSSSKTTREYSTVNTSQQAEGANIYGSSNSVNVSRADAVTLDNIAKMQGEVARDQLELSGEMVGEIVSESESARRDALSFAGESIVEQNQAIRDAQDSGYTFAGEATNRAFDGIENAMAAMERSQNAGYSFAGEATNRAFDSLDTSREDTFSFLGEAFQSAMDASADNSDRIQELARQTAGNITENSQYAMDQVQAANQDESIEAMRMIVLAGVATVGFIAWSARK